MSFSAALTSNALLLKRRVTATMLRMWRIALLLGRILATMTLRCRTVTTMMKTSMPTCL